MKKQVYHANKLVQKWEEDLHLKNLEKKLKQAKSSLPPEARGVKPAASKNTGKLFVAGSGKKTAVRKAGEGTSTPTQQPSNVQELDDLIYQRLHDILGAPLLQRVQSYAKTKPETPPKPQRTPSAYTKALAGNAGKPPKPAKRPPWNDEFAAASPSPSRPAQTSALPLPSSARSPSPGLTRNMSPAPTGSPAAMSQAPRRHSYTGNAGTAERADGGPARGGLASAQGPRVNLLVPGTPSTPGAGPSGRATPSSSRYGDPYAAHPTTLTQSHVMAIEALNPAATQGLPGGGMRLRTTSAASGQQGAAVDCSLLALSRMSTAVPTPSGQHPHTQQRVFGAEGCAPDAAGQGGAARGVGSAAGGRRVSGASEEDYEEDFEVMDDDDDEGEEGEGSQLADRLIQQEDGSGGQGGVDALRQSMHVLNKLVQLKIRELRHSQDPLDPSESDEVMMGDEGEEGPELIDDDEDTDALGTTHGLLGVDMDLGRSSLLVGGPG
eukprot:CAMPEP_0202907018 /NCGR_PEP_ID=MMETSP1392-20130828/40986_1 /ASSEMBLY_ACC=CAM_ASM_000868 /TAXON_ID=225041 /ORGANISM="Chlamydomonas chlamydogama, Strain SAG 11-48b" /LENGTH=492 /DNA_ID=CAMNT_0049595747 /DNA_START=198 /DNA_END=1672 /DNA_ORIENTATION=+